HITCFGVISWADFAKAIFKFANKSVDIQQVPASEFKSEAKRPQFSKLSTAKIEDVPHISILDWKKGLKKMMEQ
ncbi:MAG TPA: sugar nucleotide-binding protein, partial [Balneolaceae bacterium]|nr:sugar nucleotide-binding protein [Balneolaceae bacterium]